MDIPPIDIEERRDLEASEDISNALAETQGEPSVDAGPQAAEYTSPPETGKVPESVDSDTEEHPKESTRPRRERRTPLTLT